MGRIQNWFDIICPMMGPDLSELDRRDGVTERVEEKAGVEEKVETWTKQR